MKKIYTIRITAASKSNIWYSKKIGSTYEAELNIRSQYVDKRHIVFEVNPCQFVHQVDCVVTGERLVEIYKK